MIDSCIFQDSFSSKRMREIFNDTAKIQSWLDVEAALARSQARLGIIPEEAAKEITKKAKAENIDMVELRQIYSVTGHPIMPLINTFKSVCDDHHGEYIHWGATTQDIMDTGCVLQIKQALEVIEKGLIDTENICINLAKNHKMTPQAGRTHGQHAVPITFGYKVSVWIEEIRRHLARIKQCRPRVLVVEFSGAAGTLATIEVDKGFRLQCELAKELNLGVPTISWHSARDGFAEVLSLLALAMGTLAKIANEIVLLQRTEIAELEQDATGRIGSSTMPHKRNPMQFEQVIALSRMVISNANTMLGCMMGENERDWATWGTEMKIIEESFLMADAVIEILNYELRRVKVRKENMRENLDILKGLMLSERVMMKLAEKVGRQTAHDIIHEASMKAFESDLDFSSVLKSDSRVKEVLNEEEIDALMDPTTYLGLAPLYVERVCSQDKIEKDGGGLNAVS